MSESKHTPGPWAINPVDLLGEGRDENGKVVFIDAPEHGQLATVVWEFEDKEWWPETDAQCKANARLIAAAPDMLAALNAILHAYVDGGVALEQAFQMANAAIAKAEGA